MQPAAVTTRPATRDGLSRGKLTALVIAGMFTLYGVYSRTITPRVQPPTLKGQEDINTPPPVRGVPKYNLEQARIHLKHAKWAGDAKYQMRTDRDTVVYAEEWEPVDEKQAVRFTPFAMIWNQKGRREGEPPITIVCESAYVRFERKIDMDKPSPGRVIAGQLEGKVEIRGPNGLQLVGRDFRFTEKSMQLWSDQPLRFVYASHSGRAKGMECDLLPPENGKPRKKGELAVGGFRNIKLKRDVVLNLLFKGAADKKLLGLPKKPADDERRDDSRKPPTRVQVRAAGSFEFDLKTNVAKFEEDVRVYRPTKPNQYDVLQCHLLTLLFTPEKTGAKKKPPANPDDKEERFKTIDGKLTFRRLKAERKQPDGRVVLISEASKLKATMDELTYSAETKKAALRDAKQVRVEQPTSITLAKQIVLTQDKKGKVTRLDCEGAGTITHTDKKTGRVDLTASWKQRLSKFPDPESNLDIIELVDDAVLHQPKEDSTLKAELIRVWIDRDKRKEKGAAQPEPRDKDRARSRKLHRMLAKDQVTMTSPQMIAKTKRLEVWFEHPQTTESPRLSRLRLSRERPTVVGFASITDNLTPATQPDKKPDNPFALGKSKNNGPIEVTGDLIRAKIVQGRNKNETQVRRIWTLGNVVVKQEHKDGDDPLRLTGDELHVVAGKTKNAHTLHVYGKPAVLRDRGMTMKGTNLHVDRGQNVAWVDGSGVLELPIKRSLDGKKLDKPQVLEVSWKKRMTFDGAIARFRGGVRSVVEDSRVRCEEMDVYLNQRIEFADRKRQGKQKPDVKLVVCNLGVQVESYEFSELKPGKLVQFRKGRVKRFTVDQATGKTRATGRGWMSVWRYGEGGKQRIGGFAKVRANAADETSKKSPGWTYTRVDFSGASVGNLKLRYNTFQDHVKVVHGPVKRPPHVIDIDADAIPKGVGWMRCKQLRITQHKQTKDRPAYITMRGAGNAEVDGQGFHARADTITFDESQDLYTLRSLDNRNATIWRQAEAGGKQSRVDAEQLRFIPSINRLWIDKARNLNGVR